VIAVGLWGETNLTGDPAMLTTALRNLIRNAMEASQADDKIIITLDVEDSKVVITIQDSGQGMTEQQIEDAFKPFNSSKREKGGMGLGIPIARNIFILTSVVNCATKVNLTKESASISSCL